MIVKIDDLKVDVRDKKCPSRPCYGLGFDKGTFSMGRGYTSYHTDSKGRQIEKPVCATRHYNGCPITSVCSICRTCSVEAVGSACNHYGCQGVTIERAQ